MKLLWFIWAHLAEHHHGQTVAETWLPQGGGQKSAHSKDRACLRLYESVTSSSNSWLYLQCSDSGQTIKDCRGQPSSVSSYNSPSWKWGVKTGRGWEVLVTTAQQLLCWWESLPWRGWRIEVNLGSQSASKPVSRECVWVSAELLYTSSKIL